MRVALDFDHLAEIRCRAHENTAPQMVCTPTIYFVKLKAGAPEMSLMIPPALRRYLHATAGSTAGQSRHN